MVLLVPSHFEERVTSAVAATTTCLLGCENSASSRSAKVPLSQSSCISYPPDDARRIATKSPREKQGKGHWAAFLQGGR